MPRWNPSLGFETAPDLDEAVRAVARRTRSRVVPTGAVAANRLGLSEQVPARAVYLTDGRTRELRLGGMLIVLKHASPRDLPLGSPTSALVFQALKFLGKAAVDDQVVAKIRRRLSVQDRRRLRRDARYATGWIAEAAAQVAGGGQAGGSQRG